LYQFIENFVLFFLGTPNISLLQQVRTDEEINIINYATSDNLVHEAQVSEFKMKPMKLKSLCLIMHTHYYQG